MQKLITILGPTAAGKTSLAATLADQIGAEIISADSRQVYRGMDIGTGKDLEDYRVSDRIIPYHLVDIVDPGYEYNVFEFQHDFIKSFKDISKRGHKVILCGGTGMYLDAVLRNYNFQKVPENRILRKKLQTLSQEELINKLKQYGDLHNTTDLTDRERTIRAIEIGEYQSAQHEKDSDFSNIQSLNIGVRFERQLIRERITQRLIDRLKDGMIEEVKALLEGGIKPEQLIFYGLEFRYVTQFVVGEIEYEEMFGKLNTAIHQFAKRQMTWFRRMEKNGVTIHWIEGEKSMKQKVAAIQKLMSL